MSPAAGSTAQGACCSPWALTGTLLSGPPVPEPDRAWEPFSQPGAGVSLGAVSAAPGPRPRGAPRPRRLPHPAGLWALRYARYCICRGQVCAAAGQRPRLSLGPGLLATKRSLGLWRQDLAGQVGELWNGFSGARGSEGAPPWSLLPWLSLQVAVSQALGPVITIPEPGCSKTSVIFKMLLPTLYPSVLTAGRGAPRAGLVWTSERMALLYPQIHASPA